MHALRCRHQPRGQPLRRPRSAVQPQPAQRPVQHASMAASQRTGAPRLAWRAPQLVPGLPAPRPPGCRPDRRSRRTPRCWRCAVRHRQHRRAVPFLQLDEGCVDRPGWGSPCGDADPPRPRAIAVDPAALRPPSIHGRRTASGMQPRMTSGRVRTASNIQRDRERGDSRPSLGAGPRRLDRRAKRAGISTRALRPTCGCSRPCWLGTATGQIRFRSMRHRVRIVARRPQTVRSETPPRRTCRDTPTGDRHSRSMVGCD